jgi:glycosyltransferase involved in cell wall biosynthesis
MSNSKDVLFVFSLDFARKDTGGLREMAVGFLRAVTNAEVKWEAAFQWKGKLRIERDLQSVDSIEVPSVHRNWRLVLYQHTKFWKELDDYCRSNSYSCYWLQYVVGSNAMTKFVVSRELSVYLDIPTYPFIAETTGIRRIVAKLTQRNLERMAQHCVKIASPTSKAPAILGRPSMSVTNGVDTKLIQVQSDQLPAPPYRLVGFGQWSRWHGIDRLILGIARCKMQDLFIIELAGSGPIINDWDLLAKEHGVSFASMPSCYGIDRDKMIARSHAGIGTLATHRRALETDSSLKNRMYLAYGIPVIVTERDPDLPVCPEIFLVEENDDPLDMREIKDWLSQLQEDFPTVQYNLRKVGESFDWSITYKETIEELLRLQNS